MAAIIFKGTVSNYFFLVTILSGKKPNLFETTRHISRGKNEKEKLKKKEIRKEKNEI